MSMNQRDEKLCCVANGASLFAYKLNQSPARCQIEIELSELREKRNIIAKRINKRFWSQGTRRRRYRQIITQNRWVILGYQLCSNFIRFSGN